MPPKPSKRKFRDDSSTSSYRQHASRPNTIIVESRSDHVSVDGRRIHREVQPCAVPVAAPDTARAAAASTLPWASDVQEEAFRDVPDVETVVHDLNDLKTIRRNQSNATGPAAFATLVCASPQHRI